MATSVTVSATNNADIDGLLSGYKWTGTISYSFPDSPSDYSSPYSGGNSEPTLSGFASAPSQMQAAITYAIGLIQSYTNATIQYAGTNGADIMIAQSPKPNPTSYAYYPGNYAAGGDVWFGTHYDYTQAKLGDYFFTTALHELGHAFGLKHSNETGGPANVAVPSAHDDSEYTVMSYRSYVGASATAGYSNEAYGYPQTYMANDILALQTMYGANYTTQGGTTVYTWSPTTGQEFINGVGQPADNDGAGGSANRIYETVWDGGGVDTYDLSNYTTNLSINLNPGASSLFSAVQLANLGDNQNLGYDHYASGNVYNAYLYNNDARSYIDNATGGSGNDTILGNAIANVLNGGSGNDTITGGGGNDTIIGGSGTDIAVFSGNRSSYLISYNATTQTFTLVDERGLSPDGTDTVTGVESFQFADQTLSSATLASSGPYLIESAGATSLVQGSGIYLLGVGGLVLLKGGAPVAVGAYGAWAPIGAEAVAGGYDIAWKNSASGLYSFWSTDTNANFTSYLTTDLPGKSTIVESYETIFQQDFNGDGVIGVPTTTIETIGLTSLVLFGTTYELNDTTTGTGPVLKSGGSAVEAGNYGAWTPVGAEQVSGGYDIAWKNATSGLFSFWSTDTNGNYTSNLTSDLQGVSTTVETFETTFHQDFNGDGTIGIPTVTIETAGSTSLVQVGSNYHLNSISSGTGPVLKSGGNPISAGNYGAWSPIAAEQVAGGGYDVAWKNSSNGHFSFWSTDSSGNFLSDLTPEVLGNSTTVQTLEATFQQDLNGDGTIGVTIESAGSTSLGQVGTTYYLNNISTGTGPTLKSSGIAIVAGNYGAWAPIAAEQVAGGGYDIAWKNSSSGLYSFWSTDSNGNFVSNLTSDLTGSNPAVKSYEAVFHQDLNGDGAVGAAPPATAELATAGSSFVFNFSQGATTLSNSSELPDSMPLPANLQAASEQGTLAAPVESHAPVVIDALADFLHNLHSAGFMLG
ncbi:M10 family metallopeptidase C-terminal domain-containing protein [Bradyrhizobium sp. SSUT77]|uniref:M10 family metallopeptidase C-terminal domain-containing protein n=1 Tax=Bradyrhizobium sp. SSUT77 TaxID=3040603 RepID=UPI002447AB0E|nr:M10 family metallopeptidase C-terminal domain-containing protein [Bradyrhizobium sp. SSUT77]MDH2344387.1 M10 family metallopeptidase C-terminal domain-containing protein [Bradyrhizobium sp. SSUT77]